MNQHALSQTLSSSDRFVEQYYAGFSSGGNGKYYRSSSKVMWNGNGFTGDQFKTQVLPQLFSQLTGFEVTGYDSHQLAAGECALINVSGIVRLDRKERFAQTFVIERSGSLTYIQSDCFRLV
ncbi:hypothetical protein GGI21_000662 [Coemansia aciculifera]|nr:hypothetical protein GGI21_000662 [Coemansia aciculifera]